MSFPILVLTEPLPQSRINLREEIGIRILGSVDLHPRLRLSLKEVPDSG